MISIALTLALLAGHPDSFAYDPEVAVHNSQIDRDTDWAAKCVIEQTPTWMGLKSRAKIKAKLSFFCAGPLISDGVARARAVHAVDIMVDREIDAILGSR